MPLTIRFELSDPDLRYFRQRLRQVRSRGREIDEVALLERARELIAEIRDYSRATRFVSTRLADLSLLVDMLGDADWSLGGRDRLRVVEGLTYFVEGEDLIPDRVPSLGYLDDAIMIELIVQDLRHEIEAYRDFVGFRRDARALPPRAPQRRRGLAPRRDELLSRMRRRIRSDRARRAAGGGASGSVL